MWLEIAMACILTACVCIFFTIKTSEKVESQVVSLLEEARTGINEQFSAFEPLIKRYYTSIGKLGHDSQELERGKKMIVGDVLKMNPILEAGLDFLSPKTREWVDNNPDQAMELIPQLQKIAQQLGIIPGEGQDPTQRPRSQRFYGPEE